MCWRVWSGEDALRLYWKKEIVFMASYQQQVGEILKGQQAPLIGGERHILARCGQCGRIWLMQGVKARLHLSQEEVLQWAERLGAKCDDLPGMTCRACAVRSIGGEFMFDEYAEPDGTIRGYGFSWEAMDPPAHMLVGVFHLAWLSAVQPQEKSFNIVTNPQLARAVLSWLSTSTLLQGAMGRPFPPEALAALAMTNPPGAHAPGTQGWVWCGATWDGLCGSLEGTVNVTFAWAGHPPAVCELASALSEWREVAQRAAKYGIAGESLS
jgi:hypothetical protein